MIVPDENILADQRFLLEASRIATKQIGVDAGRKGPALRHQNYCLVVMNVGQNEVATFVRRFLRHPNFNTQAKRMGRVVRASHAGLAVWRLGLQTEIRTVWNRLARHIR